MIGRTKWEINLLRLQCNGVLIDILTSDYVTSSLPHSPCILTERGMALHRAIATVTAKPADAVGSRIAVGLRPVKGRIYCVSG
ncbi:hypothetical protein BQ8482_290115 [Mesorhizobium delmotii]|uniref:Uncharacterized protein n=1 Tax=Mesorhizobium delmotii TaxID=1631247 RepID=A0A2P9AN07_9HYPH|nr:hypothetical protein BQ8482_290115 [Mesorhizobium delmotii]